MLFSNMPIAYRALIALHALVLQREEAKASRNAAIHGGRVNNVVHGWKHDDAKKIRRTGRALSNGPVLMFTLARYALRGPLLRYAQLAQSIQQTGFEKVRAQSRTIQHMHTNIAMLHVLSGIVGISQRLWGFVGRRGQPALTLSAAI